MKKLYTLIFVLMFSHQINAQKWIWALNANGDFQFALADRDIAVDHFGNSYITGYYIDTISMGDFSLHNPSDYYSRIFLGKIDSDNTVLWLKDIPQSGNSYNESVGIHIDESNSCYLTGTAGGYIFVAKYNSEGNEIWYSDFNHEFGGIGKDVTTDQYENVFTIGRFFYYLGGAFISKTDSKGSTIWTKQIISTCNTNGCSGNDIAVDAHGNIYVTGVFSCDSIMIDSVVLKHKGFSGYNTFIAAFTPNGDVIWAKAPDGKTNGIPQIALSDQGMITLAGSFQSFTISFDSISLTKVASGNDASPFIAQYNDQGVVQWASVSHTHYDGTGLTRDIISDFDGNIYLTGTDYGYSDEDFYIEKYNELGEIEMMEEILIGDQWSYGIGIDADSSAYIIGQSDRKGVFSGMYPNVPTVYIAKLNTGAKINLRPLRPEVNPMFVFCNISNLDSIYADGEDISWFSDSLLQNLVHKGNKFLPNIENTTPFYVTQKKNGRTSWLSKTIVFLPDFDTFKIENRKHTLFVNYNNLYNYKWHFEDSLMTDCTRNFCVPDLSGVYKVRISIENCFKELSFNFNANDVAEQSNNDFSIFPNPSDNFLSIELPKKIDEIDCVELYDMQGKCVLSIIKNTYSRSLLIDMSNLKKGLYVINIKYDNNCFKRKIIKN